LLANPLFRKYAELVLEKNKLLNLTAAATVEEILERHINDGLAALDWLDKRFPSPRRGEDAGPDRNLSITGPVPRRSGARSAGEGLKVVDVGAGAGFIGLALKIARPDIKLTLIESRKGRTEFLEWAAIKLQLKVEVRRSRAEALAPHPTLSPAGRGEQYDVVVERALAPLPEALDLCLPLVAPGGVFLAYQSESEPADPRRPVDTIRYRLAGEKKDRFILCFER